jgi:uncharacterized membrane protein YhhN
VPDGMDLPWGNLMRVEYRLTKDVMTRATAVWRRPWWSRYSRLLSAVVAYAVLAAAMVWAGLVGPLLVASLGIVCFVVWALLRCGSPLPR